MNLIKTILIGLVLLITTTAQAALIYPTAVTTQQGTSTATVAQLSAADSSWGWFYLSGTNTHTSKFAFTQPATPAGDVLTSIRIDALLFGNPDSSPQKWRLQLQNLTTGLWDTITSTATGTYIETQAGWGWQLSGLVTNPLDYVVPGQGFQVRYISVLTDPNMQNPASSALDYVWVDVTHTTPQSTWANPPKSDWEIRYAGALIPDDMLVSSVNVDLEDYTAAKIGTLKANGKYVVCYFSAGSYESWRSDAGEFDTATKGNNMAGWAGERWVDVRALADLMPIMNARMDMAVTKGCDAVDPDNMDSYDPQNNSGFPHALADNQAYFNALKASAHSRGLAIGLKNALLLIPNVTPDYYVNEQCLEYAECSAYATPIRNGAVVFNVEYNLKGRTIQQLCNIQNAAGILTLKKTLALNATRTSCADY